jgi:CRISPR-associated protein Cas2
MWLIVMFDLPTKTKLERKKASMFRRLLLKDGFSHMQHSVYLRHCATRENANLHIKRVKSFLPNKGTISIIRITDKQFGMIESFYGHSPIPPPLEPHQLEMF